MSLAAFFASVNRRQAPTRYFPFDDGNSLKAGGIFAGVIMNNFYRQRRPGNFALTSAITIDLYQQQAAAILGRNIGIGIPARSRALDKNSNGLMIHRSRPGDAFNHIGMQRHLPIGRKKQRPAEHRAALPSSDASRYDCRVLANAEAPCGGARLCFIANDCMLSFAPARLS